MAGFLVKNKIVTSEMSRQPISNADSSVNQPSDSTSRHPSGSIRTTIADHKRSVLACTSSHPRGFTIWKKDVVEDAKKAIQRQSYEKMGCEEKSDKGFDVAAASDAKYIQDEQGYTIGMLVSEASETNIEKVLDKCAETLQECREGVEDPQVSIE